MMNMAEVLGLRRQLLIGNISAFDDGVVKDDEEPHTLLNTTVVDGVISPILNGADPAKR